MSGEVKDSHSSGEYSGVVEEADVGYATGGGQKKASDISTVISSGLRAQKKREENREAAQKQAAEREAAKK